MIVRRGQQFCTMKCDDDRVRLISVIEEWKRSQDGVVVTIALFFVLNRYLCVVGYPWETFPDKGVDMCPITMPSLSKNEWTRLLRAMSHPFLFPMEISYMEPTKSLWKPVLCSVEWSWLIDDVYRILESGVSGHDAKVFPRDQRVADNVPAGFHHRFTNIFWVRNSPMLVIVYATVTRCILVRILHRNVVSMLKKRQ